MNAPISNVCSYISVPSNFVPSMKPLKTRKVPTQEALASDFTLSSLN
jgi:hypothetical protein